MFRARDSVFHLTVLRVGEPAVYMHTALPIFMQFRGIHKFIGCAVCGRGLVEYLKYYQTFWVVVWKLGLFLSPALLSSLFFSLSLSSLRISVAWYTIYNVPEWNSYLRYYWLGSVNNFRFCFFFSILVWNKIFRNGTMQKFHTTWIDNLHYVAYISYVIYAHTTHTYTRIRTTRDLNF